MSRPWWIHRILSVSQPRVRARGVSNGSLAHIRFSQQRGPNRRRISQKCSKQHMAPPPRTQMINRIDMLHHRADWRTTERAKKKETTRIFNYIFAVDIVNNICSTGKKKSLGGRVMRENFTASRQPRPQYQIDGQQQQQSQQTELIL